MTELFLSSQFWISLGQMVAINLVLSGDSALVIAMVARSKSPAQQKHAIFWGSAVAITVRLTLTVVAFELLRLPYMKIAGGTLLFWICIQMLLPDSDDEHNPASAAPVVVSTLAVIMLANLAMGLDNVLGIAAAAADNKMMLALGIVISATIIGFGASLTLGINRRFPAVYPVSVALIAYLAGDMLVADTAIKDWANVHLQWLQTVTVGHLSISVAGLIAAAAVFSAARLFRSFNRRVDGNQGDKAWVGSLSAAARLCGHLRSRLAGYRIMMLIPYAIILAVVYLGHPIYVYHKNWLLKQIRYHGISLGMTPDELLRYKGNPLYVVDNSSGDTAERLVGLSELPIGKTITDYREWQYHIGTGAPASLEIIFSGSPMEVSQIGCYSEKGYCPPLAGISTGASADEVIDKLGKPRNVRASKMNEIFDYPELHLSVMLVSQRVVMLMVHNRNVPARGETAATTQH